MVVWAGILSDYLSLATRDLYDSFDLEHSNIFHGGEK